MVSSVAFSLIFNLVPGVAYDVIVGVPVGVGAGILISSWFVASQPARLLTHSRLPAPRSTALLRNSRTQKRGERHASFGTPPRRLACLADVEAAAQRALQTGSFFFADIERNQVSQKGVALLRYLAAQGEGAIVRRDTLAQQLPDDLDSTLKQLLRRDLIEQINNGYRFQVELIRRWFAKSR